MASEKHAEAQSGDSLLPRFWRATTHNQGQVVAIIIFASVMAMIIGGLYLAQATTDITNKNDIRQLEDQRRRLERENELLRAEIAELQSVDSLVQRAATLGYQPADLDDIQWLVVDGYVYNQPVPTATPLVFTPTPIVYDDNFAGWLRHQFDLLQKQFEQWAR